VTALPWARRQDGSTLSSRDAASATSSSSSSYWLPIQSASLRTFASSPSSSSNNNTTTYNDGGWPDDDCRGEETEATGRDGRSGDDRARPPPSPLLEDTRDGKRGGDQKPKARPQGGGDSGAKNLHWRAKRMERSGDERSALTLLRVGLRQYPQNVFIGGVRGMSTSSACAPSLHRPKLFLFWSSSP
jgi:hypothetical protein